MDIERYERLRGDARPVAISFTDKDSLPLNTALYSWRIAAKKKVKDTTYSLDPITGVANGTAGTVTFDISEDLWFAMELGEHTFEVEGTLYGTYKPEIKRQFIMTLFQEIMPNQDPPVTP